MHFIFKPLARLCVLCVLCGSGFAIDREAFAFERYDLKVQLDPELQLLNATGTITLRNVTKEPQHVVSLQISSQLNWAEIQVKGANGEWKPVQYVGQEYTTDIDHTGAVREAIVSLPSDVGPKQSVELKVGYAGEIHEDATRLDRIGTARDVAQRVDWDRITKDFTLLRGVGFVAWYPVASDAESLSDGNAVQESLARWREREAGAVLNTEVCLPDAKTYPTMIASGRTQGSASPDAFVIDSRCGEFSFELGRVTPVIAIGPYQVFESPVRVAYLPAHEDSARAFYNNVPAARQTVSNWLGDRARKSALVDLPFPALPFETGDLRLMNLSGQDPQMRESALSHVLAHAALPSPRPWIYEGAANFLQAVVKENQEGRAAALDLLARQNAVLFEIERQNGEHPEQAADHSLINTSDQVLYGDKSAWVLWMLRDMLGESALKAALAKYDPAADKSADYFQKLLETESKKDLEWFFDGWVYRDRGLPAFRIESANAREILSADAVPGASAGDVGKSHLVTVTVGNSGGAGAEVLVTVRGGGHEQSSRLIVKANDKSVVRLNVPFTPEEIAVNDGSVPESDTANNSYKLPTGNESRSNQ